MGRIACRSSALQQKIEGLKNTLLPFTQCTTGEVHPAFPKNIMAFFLLTEDELDSLAHFYHQSTPGIYTHSYPVSMNWDKEFLARTPTDGQPNHNHTTGTSHGDAHKGATDGAFDPEAWVIEVLADFAPSPPMSSLGSAPGFPGRSHNPYAQLTRKQRICIKRRKFGKFIGCRSMETPTEEIFGRVQAGLDRAIARDREELQRNEDKLMGRRKVG